MDRKTVSQTKALVALYNCVNSPSKAGPKWATYSREQADAMIKVLKDILTARGVQFK